MKIGKRTQAYFVGFLIGIAIVSVLVDSRRDRSLENAEAVYSWKRTEASLEELPQEILNQTKAAGYITGVAQYDAADKPTGQKGYFFSNPDGALYWLFGSVDEMKLYDGTKLAATSQPGLEWDLMKAGFEHQGHTLVSRRALAPHYVLKIDVHSAINMIDAYENLKSKTNFIAEVNWVEPETETAKSSQ